jgi:hypothetical protein
MAELALELLAINGHAVEPREISEVLILETHAFLRRDLKSLFE